MRKKAAVFSGYPRGDGEVFGVAHRGGMLGGTPVGTIRGGAAFTPGGARRWSRRTSTGILQERPDLTALLDVTRPEPPIPDRPHPRHDRQRGGLTSRRRDRGFRGLGRGAPAGYERAREVLETMGGAPRQDPEQVGHWVGVSFEAR